MKPALLALPLAAMAATVPALPAAAELLYADFEIAVPHLDLDACPAEIAEAADQPVFCRVTLGHDSLHVFAFAEAGDRPFLLMRTYFEEDFTLGIGD